ncbi:TVP38/TMEM64 family protein [Desulfitobacterium metallireducens]|uniref:TVP38/TMEM64 family membrane protein n=1 Tax=Desulfitobacterium metallireducens DSM 15288 TaxID=871968 RepID=W0EAK1_9FIRM|nr:VTT domain-containing protein [Desulfitobacterium metallireducens]AHF06229.1 hypothetical protein DESME_03530 [Desulfitobacterium metallireducens DSM 15288]
MESHKIEDKNYGWLTLILVISVLLIVLFFYLDRQNNISYFIQTWGIGGIFLGILLMAALCMTPIPSEGLVILLLKIYGVYGGILYSWLGSILSSIAIFYITRYLGKSFFQKLLTPQRFETVDHWIQKKGSSGLLIARLLPIPAFAVNYIAGAIPSVKLWPYTWTAALSIIPYYIGTALVYIGVAQSTWIWLAVGGVAILTVWGISYFLSKTSKNQIS